MSVLTASVQGTLYYAAQAKAIGKLIHTAFATFGWLQTNDTGQRVWDALSIVITNATLSGNVITYTYTSVTGLPSAYSKLIAGRSVTVTGFSNASFNVSSQVITSVTASTFTVALVHTDIATETPGSPAAGAIASDMPGDGGAQNHYEIWKMNDTLAATVPVFVKVTLVYASSTNSKGIIKIETGIGSNGLGALTGGGTVMTPAVAGSSAAANCYFSGDTNRMQMMLWRDDVGGCTVYSIERFHNSDGTDNGNGVLAVGCCNGSSGLSVYDMMLPTGTVGTSKRR